MTTLVISHPLVADRLRIVRDRSTTTAPFRAAIAQLGAWLVYEALRGMDHDRVEVTTPMAPASATKVGENVLFVPVLRAGLGILDSAISVFPEASIGFVGMARDEQSHVPATYLTSLPPDLNDQQIVVLDPMLATGGSLIATCEELVSRGARHIITVTVLCAPEGLAALEKSGLPVDVVTASIDERLNADAFIIPGLGDAGDRLFGPR